MFSPEMDGQRAPSGASSSRSRTGSNGGSDSHFAGLMGAHNFAGSAPDSGRGREGSGTLLRVLTLNMAVVSPGWGTLRYYLQICAAGMFGAAVGFFMLARAGLVHPSIGIVLIMYGVGGTSLALGCRRWIVILFGLAVTGSVVALRAFDFNGPFLILAGFGFCEFTFFFHAQLLGQVLMITLPRFVECYFQERVELFLHHLKEGGPYDVVCVQEASVIWGRANFRHKLETGAAQLGLRHVAWTGKWPRFPAVAANSGLGIFSRHPIINASVHVNYFREQYLLEWAYVQRGMLSASIQPPGTRRVDICTLHNTASVDNTSTGTGCTCSCSANGNAGSLSLSGRQVVDALDWFRSVSPPRTVTSRSRSARGGAQEVLGIVDEGSPLCTLPALRILCGDFNFEKHSASFKHVASVADEYGGLADAVPDSEATFGNVDEDGNPTEWCLTFKMDQKRPRVLDHIFADSPAVSGGVVAMCNNDHNTRHLYQQASDHRGVEAAFLI